MTAERNIAITSYSEDVVAGSSLLEKRISGSATRSFKFVKKNGEEGEGSFSSETLAEQPIVVKVKRSLADNSQISREIVSGTRINTHKNGSIAEISFSGLLIEGAGESCNLKSGNFSIKNLDSAGTMLSSISCSAEDGSLSCTDASGMDVEQEVPLCDPSDDK